MCPSFGLWGGLGLWFPVYYPQSTIGRRAPALMLCERAFLFSSPYTCTLCLVFSLDPSVVGLTPPCACWWKDIFTWSCASHTCVTWSAKGLAFFLSCTSIFELGVEVAFNIRSAVTLHTVNPLKSPLQSSCSERTDDAFVLLICFCFFHL